MQVAAFRGLKQEENNKSKPFLQLLIKEITITLAFRTWMMRNVSHLMQVNLKSQQISCYSGCATPVS